MAATKINGINDLVRTSNAVLVLKKAFKNKDLRATLKGGAEHCAECSRVPVESIVVDSRYYLTPRAALGWRLATEVRGKRPSAARQQRGVEADRDEQRTGGEIAARSLGVGREDSWRLAGREHGGDAGVDRRSTSGWLALPRWPIDADRSAGPEEDAVDAVRSRRSPPRWRSPPPIRPARRRRSLRRRARHSLRRCSSAKRARARCRDRACRAARSGSRRPRPPPARPCAPSARAASARRCRGTA